MKINFERWKSIRTYWKILTYISFFFFAGSTLGFADARSDMQMQCSQKLGFAGVAVKDNFSAENKWVCGCRGAFMWNQDRSACIKRQTNGADTANQQPPDDSREPTNAEGGNNQPPKKQPVVRISPKKLGQTPPSGRTRKDTQLACNQQLGFAGIAVKENLDGQTNWVCGCRNAFQWNQDGSACVKRQSNGGSTANPQQPKTPPVVRTPGLTIKKVVPRPRTRQDTQLMCSKQLGFAGIAVKDNTNGQPNWVCDCRSAFQWNQDGSACVKRQSNGANTAGQQPTELPPVVRTPRKKVKRAPPPRRKKKVVRTKTKKKKRVVRSKSATAHGYCRRRYGRRLVRVNVKGSKFYCHYKGKNAVGRNPRIKWKRIEYNSLR